MDRGKKTITKEDLLFGGRKKKHVDIADDDDFPDLDEDAEDPFLPQPARPQTRGPKPAAPVKRTT